MSLRPLGRTAIGLAIVFALALGGCAALKKKKPELAYEEHPVDVLYNAGADRLDRHQWSEAVDYFKEVERQHPYSEWARRSILMTAYAHYMANDYADAIQDANQFISLYPGNESAQYAYYLKAICYFEQIVDVGRDQAATSEAGEALREVAKRYPYSEYAVDAKLKIDMVQDQLAGKEMSVGRYYLRNGDPMGAIGRFRTVVDKYQTTSHTPEALYRLVEAYLTLGLVEEAKRNAAVLGFNYPGDPWYADAYALMMSKGLKPAVAPNPSGRRGTRSPGFDRNKSTALPPPGETSAVTPASATTDAAAQGGAATSDQPRKGGFVHGFLGL